MKRNTKIILILNIAVILFMLGMLVYQLFIAEEKDIKIIIRAGSLCLVYFLAITGLKKKHSPLDYIIYADEHSDVIGSAFKNEKSAYRKLMKGLTLYKRKKYDKALKILEEAKRDCLYSDDFTAVLFFKACCLKEKISLPRLKSASRSFWSIMIQMLPCGNITESFFLIWKDIPKQLPPMKAL